MPTNVTALIGGKVINGNGQVFEDGVVVLENGKVMAAGSRQDVTVPADAVQYDVTGHSVIPGLIDVHVHLSTYSLPGKQDFMRWGLVTSEDLKLMHGVNNARLTLEAGVTTVRNMGHDGDIALRDAVNMGLIPGPRILTSGNVNMTAGHSDMFTPPHFERKPGATADGPDEVRKAVRQKARAGADFIKICTTGGVMSMGDAPDWRNYTLEEIQVITDEAHALGRRVAAHAQVPSGIKNAILGGVDTIEHGNVLDDECIELMIKHGVFLVPTLAVVYQVIKLGVEMGLPEYGVEKAKRVHEQHLESIARAHKAGVKIAMGTDAAFNICRNGDNALELELMCNIGMSPLEAIEVSTRVAAEAMGLADEVGTLEAGKVADVVVVKGDVLADIRSLQDKNNVSLVFQGGRKVVDRR